MGSHISCTNRSASGGSPSAVSAGQLYGKGIRRQIQPGWSRSQLGVARWRKEESRRNCGNHNKTHFQPLSRWALSYNVQSHIAAATRKMFALLLGDHMTHSESTPTRMRRNHNDECQIMQCLRTFKVFGTNSPIDTVHNIATMDLATDDIQESLVNAERLDQKQLNAVFSINIHFVKLWKFFSGTISYGI